MSSIFFGDDLRPAVLGSSGAVEDAADDVLGDAQLLGAAEEPDARSLDVEADRALEDLDHGLLGRNVEDLAAAPAAAGRLDLDELAELDVRRPSRR